MQPNKIKHTHRQINSRNKMLTCCKHWALCTFWIWTS